MTSAVIPLPVLEESVDSQTQNTSPSLPWIQTSTTSIPHFTRPQRTRKQPSYLKDYVCNNLMTTSQVNTSGVVHPLSNFISYNRCNDSYVSFLAAISSQDEPKTFS